MEGEWPSPRLEELHARYIHNIYYIHSINIYRRYTYMAGLL